MKWKRNKRDAVFFFYFFWTGWLFDITALFMTDAIDNMSANQQRMSKALLQCTYAAWPIYPQHSFYSIAVVRCTCDWLCLGVDFTMAGSWVTTALVAGLTGRHVRNLCVRFEWRAAVSGEESAEKRAQTPVLSERLLCRVEQVSAEQLRSSLKTNTLNYSHLSSGPHQC